MYVLNRTSAFYLRSRFFWKSPRVGSPWGIGDHVVRGFLPRRPRCVSRENTESGFLPSCRSRTPWFSHIPNMSFPNFLLFQPVIAAANSQKIEDGSELEIHLMGSYLNFAGSLQSIGYIHRMLH